MSQAAQTQTGKKHGGMFRALFWAVALMALGALGGYVLFDVLGSILATSGGGLLIASQVLHSFGYVNASNAITGQAMTYIYQSQVFPYVGAVSVGGIGFIIGYFKGKREDAEEAQ